LESVVVQPGVGGIDNPIALLFEPNGGFLVRGSNSRILRYGPGSLAAFTLSLTSAAGAPVSVNYTTADGTAIGDAGSTLGDYHSASGTAIFAPGETSKTIVVATRDDIIQETSEAFSINLSSTDATVLDGQGIATIIDNDSQPDVVSYASTNVPKSIPSPGTVQSILSVSDSFSILDVDVRLDITHSFDGDLSVYLIGPDGTRVKLFAGVYGGSGKNFTGTILDDEAALPITGGTAPFTGRFRPMEPLSAFDGKNSAGTWKLEITDSSRPNKGTLISWSLDFTRTSTAEAAKRAADAAAPAALADGVLEPAARRSPAAAAATPRLAQGSAVDAALTELMGYSRDLQDVEPVPQFALRLDALLDDLMASIS
jgi:subtilisin-like proprotein convertase family protein